MIKYMTLIALAAATLASTATAYETEPTFTVMEAGATPAAPGEVCVPPLSPELVAALSIQSVVDEKPQIALACLTDK